MEHRAKRTKFAPSIQSNNPFNHAVWLERDRHELQLIMTFLGPDQVMYLSMASQKLRTLLFKQHHVANSWMMHTVNLKTRCEYFRSSVADEQRLQIERKNNFNDNLGMNVIAGYPTEFDIGCISHELDNKVCIFLFLFLMYMQQYMQQYMQHMYVKIYAKKYNI